MASCIYGDWNCWEVKVNRGRSWLLWGLELCWLCCLRTQISYSDGEDEGAQPQVLGCEDKEVGSVRGEGK